MVAAAVYVCGEQVDSHLNGARAWWLMKQVVLQIEAERAEFPCQIVSQADKYRVKALELRTAITIELGYESSYRIQYTRQI